jgi:phage shock protein PspC (stress-responsive transcriptional regulator)
MEPKRKLYRSRARRTIAGVCCGLADYVVSTRPS